MCHLKAKSSVWPEDGALLLFVCSLGAVLFFDQLEGSLPPPPVMFDFVSSVHVSKALEATRKSSSHCWNALST